MRRQRAGDGATDLLNIRRSQTAVAARLCRRIRNTYSVSFIALLAFVLTCGGSLMGCRKSPLGARETTLSVDFEISPQPPRAGPATITLRISGSDGKPMSGVSVRLEGNMTHAGMAPSFGTAEEISPGRYRAPFDFSMGGDWIILVHLTLPNREKLERQFDVKGVQPG